MRVDAIQSRLHASVIKVYQATEHIWPVKMPRQSGKQKNLRSFVNQLNVCMAPFGIHNRIVEDPQVEPGDIQHSGWWYDASELPTEGSRAPIHILWHTHPAVFRFQWNSKIYKERRYIFWSFVLHEMIHRIQAKHRRKLLGPDAESRRYAATARHMKLREDQEYFGDYDEIETYAFDSALQFYCWFNAPPRSQWLKLSQMSCCGCSPTYIYYLSHFSDKSHPAVRAFNRKVAAWVECLRKNPGIYTDLQLVA